MEVIPKYYEIKTKGSFQAMMEKIISDEFPNELDTFHLFAPELIEKLFSGEDILEETREDNASFELGEGISEILNFIIVLSGTFKAFFELKKAYISRKENKHEDGIFETWKEELKSAGLDESTANQIVLKFKSNITKKNVNET